MSRKTVFTGSAAGRRRERRLCLQPVAIDDVGLELAMTERPTPSKVERAARRRINRVKKAVAPIHNEYGAQIQKYAEIVEARCKKIDRINHQNWYSEPKKESGFDCRGRQPVRGKSIPLV